MTFGFDAKRYFHNPTGLGNYSRTLVNALARMYPEHRYLLFNPKPATRFALPEKLPMAERLPAQRIHQMFPSVWRSNWITADLRQQGVELYHGLSHELPVGIGETGIRSVVTVHDLIFERYPHQYSAFDVYMHRRKVQYACKHANRVIAISKQTADDLIARYQVPAAKIDVCYQSCDPAFAEQQPEARKATVRKAYNLPEEFFLYVGSIIERKNLLTICRAMQLAGAALQAPLVVVGTGKRHKQQVVTFLQQHGLANRVLFLAERQPIDATADIKSTANLAALYQMAQALIYPSFFEGFGIPVLEALWSKVPVITSNVSCMPETGGDGVYYVDPANAGELASAMIAVQNNPALCSELVEKGWRHAQQFSVDACAASVMAVYQNLI